MSNYYLKAAAMALLSITLGKTGFSQDQAPTIKRDQAPVIMEDKASGNQEIIIRKKGDKNVKVTVEIKDNKIFINGKPSGEYHDNNVSVRTITLRNHADVELDGDISIPQGDFSPFRSMTFESDQNFPMNIDMAPVAFLGVTMEKADAGGAKITDLTKEGSAEKAGLQKGDIITHINETSIGSPEDLTKVIHNLKPEDKITVTYMRDGKEQKATAVLGKKQLTFFKTFNIDQLDQPSMEKLEKLQELTNEARVRADIDKARNEQFRNDARLREELDKLRAEENLLRANRNLSFGMNGRPRLGIKAQDLEEGKGAKVLEVDEESPAEKAGLKEGDIITEFDGKPVNNADDLASHSREARDKNNFKIKIKREDKTQEIEVKIPKKLKTADL